MYPLKITFGGLFGGLIVALLLLLLLFYLVGKKRVGSAEKQPTPIPSPFKPNPSTPKAKQAFLNNIDRLVPFFSGVKDITIDKNGLTDAIIDINDDDLLALWHQTMNNPKMWITLMASFGLSADARTVFVAMDIHKTMYTTNDGSEIQLGLRYSVISACWILTTTDEDGRSVKKVVKKGMVKQIV